MLAPTLDPGEQAPDQQIQQIQRLVLRRRRADLAEGDQGGDAPLLRHACDCLRAYRGGVAGQRLTPGPSGAV